jgi:hypothetical protein
MLVNKQQIKAWKKLNSHKESSIKKNSVATDFYIHSRTPILLVGSEFVEFLSSSNDV